MSDSEKKSQIVSWVQTGIPVLLLGDGSGNIYQIDDNGEFSIFLATAEHTTSSATSQPA